MTLFAVCLFPVAKDVSLLYKAVKMLRFIFRVSVRWWLVVAVEHRLLSADKPIVRMRYLATSAAIAAKTENFAARYHLKYFVTITAYDP